MILGRSRPLSLSELLMHILPAIALALSLASVMSGCGVRQFGAKLNPNAPATASGLSNFGPFYSAGQGNGTMSASSCAPGPGHHPCARVRASVGMPYQFDVNPNGVQGPVTVGATYSAPAAYAGIAGSPAGEGAGKTKASANKPRAENRDLHMLQRANTQSDQAF
jgi:hypothetical protein